MSNTYNGWTNYATWRVNLEIFDGMNARDITGRAVPVISELKDALRELAEETIESTSGEGLARDYALAFLSDVNWWEIANTMLVNSYVEDGQPIPEELWKERQTA